MGRRETVGGIKKLYKNGIELADATADLRALEVKKE
jgi:hypothetical protein